MSGRSYFRRGGFATRDEACTELATVHKLLEAAQLAVDPATARAAIGTAVHAAIAAGRLLPDVGQVRVRIRRGLPPVQAITVEQWLCTWLDERTDLRPATALSYRSLAETYLVPLLGGLLLEDLRPEHVRAALARITTDAEQTAQHNAERHAAIAETKRAWSRHDTVAARAARAELTSLPGFRRPASLATVQRIRAVLRSALSEAVRRELVAVNVAKLVRIPAPRRARPLEWTPARERAWRETGQRPSPVMVWTPAQTRTFLTWITKHRLHAVFVVLAYTGARRGEACGLRWDDVDLHAREAAIRRQLVQVGSRTIEAPPKTAASIRTVALAPAVTDALTAWRRLQNAERRAAGTAWVDTGLVFTGANGAALNPAAVSDTFKHLVREARLPPIRLHDLRHGAATQALDAGVPAKVVSDMLGHSSITVTLDLYPATTDHALHTAANAIARRLEH
ncbi:integrase [Catenulispora sp. GAS73]|uniref:tyrosine-type recombinase/integrase n=1 Tax=Catenulispora sp. GAS73 TaxID=3156269 RepID=UPI0035193F93